MNDRYGLNDLLKNEIQIDKVNIFIFKLRTSPRGIQQKKKHTIECKNIDEFTSLLFCMCEERRGMGYVKELCNNFINVSALSESIHNVKKFSSSLSGGPLDPKYGH